MLTAYTFAADDSLTITQNGRGVWPGIGVITTGSFSRTFDDDGSAGPLTGTGSQLSYCDQLS